MRQILFFGFLLLSIPCLSQIPSWSRVDALPASDIFCLTIQHNTIYAGTMDKVYIGVDSGATWIMGASLGNVGYVATIIEFHQKIYAGTNGAGVFSSDDSGATWQPVNAGLSFPYITSFAVWNGRLYAGTQGNGFYAFDDNLNQWSAFNMGFFINVGGNIAALAVIDSALVAAGGANGVFYQYDSAAASWNYSYYLANGLLPGLLVNALLVDSNLMLAATSFRSDIVLRSDDGGNHWSSDGNGIQFGTAAMAVDGQNDYVAMNSFNGVQNTTTLYQRKRNVVPGTPWDSAMVVPFADFVYALGTDGGRLYAASDSGLYYRGQPKETMAQGPPVDSGGGRLVIYPNPAGAFTNLRFHLSGGQVITVRLLDVLGQRVSIPYVDHPIGGGFETLPLETGDLSPGVYFVEITGVGGYRQTKELLVVR